MWAGSSSGKGIWLRAGRPGFDPGCRKSGEFSSLLRVQNDPGVHYASSKMSTGGFPGDKGGASIGLATLPLPSAVAVNM